MKRKGSRNTNVDVLSADKSSSPVEEAQAKTGPELPYHLAQILLLEVIITHKFRPGKTTKEDISPALDQDKNLHLRHLGKMKGWIARFEISFLSSARDKVEATNKEAKQDLNMYMSIHESMLSPLATSAPGAALATLATGRADPLYFSFGYYHKGSDKNNYKNGQNTEDRRPNQIQSGIVRSEPNRWEQRGSSELPKCYGYATEDNNNNRTGGNDTNFSKRSETKRTK
ncbi:telomeric repeat binding protein 1 [Striga asiatica]|uniref:Telomeric repeat binding protein 1 n=1 Tax=Striga asiatica TaxID=4170 RepID=A0A5A7Q2I9_STRAF|nr:telomeric repeat binding protein 1 [Striga asiatica]